MFEKVLIANRGEIACRVLRTLRRLGMRSVAVHSDVERYAAHVLSADEAICIGGAPASQSYLDATAVIAAARTTSAQAIHPGYGFLSENADFAQAVEESGLVWIGPTPNQMRLFGRKHQAREIAERRGIPLLPGSGLLANVDEALAVADSIGYPLMIKSTAGGGGIGLQLCRNVTELGQRYASVQALAQKNFAEGGIFLERFVERARHIEVQIFGDGQGQVLSLGERDCSAQRRHQKVIEETPAVGLRPELRAALESAAVELGRSVAYRSAGTVEFIYDVSDERFYFLEVNTRLQVEHGITELARGIDLVEWMIRIAAGETLPSTVPAAHGHAVEVRLYAEDPTRDFRPCAGTLTEVQFPSDVRVDRWVERGTEVTGFYDPLLAKLMVWGKDRDSAVLRLNAALDQTQLAGIETNLEYLRQLARDEVFRLGRMTTAFLGGQRYPSATLEVIAPGTMSTIQDYPGRIGYWDVGVPPSGPMDDLGFRLANRAVGNAPGTAGLEVTVNGPTLRFATSAVIALGGADFEAELDGIPLLRYRPIEVSANQVLSIGTCRGPGCRGYLAIRHGIDVPPYLGSRSTFTLGGFGGHAGRQLRRGDVLHLARASEDVDDPAPIDQNLAPELTEHWTIGVLYGPHGAPDFFLPSDIEMLFSTDWEVHYNSARTGVRLIGPKPGWARPDGGEAGLHPSNLHDNAYAIGTIDFTGDMPILLGPDGPSLGGFVCPATVVAAERWKLGQLKPGATVRFLPISFEQANQLEVLQRNSVVERRQIAAPALVGTTLESAVLRQLPPTPIRPTVTYRPAGDQYLLIEYGPMALDLTLRFRVHLLMQRLAEEGHRAILDLTPGIRSLQIHYDSRTMALARLLGMLECIEADLPALDQVTVPTRIVHLPLSWDDPATRLAIEKYMQGVRRDAPWTPSNLEFIRRINGLASIDDVKRIVFDASYLVLGLGDVYLGAPVATPIDPCHRLVTTKYNPARTWTPENAVGIGGAYLCVYGLEGPGGYQFVGRTIQMFNRYKTTREFTVGRPWLLRFFDQIRFYPVTADELLEMRSAFPHGRLELRIEEGKFSLADYLRQVEGDSAKISAFKATQQSAFDAERRRWVEQGAMLDADSSMPEPDRSVTLAPLSSDELGVEAVECHVHGSVWQRTTQVGAHVHAGDPLLVVESMKMEIVIESTLSGTVTDVRAVEGQSVIPGQILLTIRRDD